MPTSTSSIALSALGHYRWVICALLFFATTVNYIDRQVIGILKPTLQKEFGWSEIDYADIVFAFQLAYAMRSRAGRTPDGLAGHPRTASPSRSSSGAWRRWRTPRRRFGPYVAPMLGTFGSRVPRHRSRDSCRPLRARSRRGRQFPGVHQDGGGVVPEEGTRARDGHLQLGHQRRGAAHAAGRALDHPDTGAGTGRSSSPGSSVSSGSCWWLPIYAAPGETSAGRPAELATSAAIPPTRQAMMPVA